MIQNLPHYIEVVFGLITIVSVLLFYVAIKRSAGFAHKANTILLGLLIWMGIQMILALLKVYSTNTTDLPPRFGFMFLPTLIFMLVLFNTKKGKVFIDSLPMLNLTYLSIVRIPVEFVLFWLFLKKALPELATFEGRNFDILAGFTAPLAAYFGISKGKMSRTFLLIWNFAALALLTNIVANATLAVPSALQQIAFDQPNIAILHFPFVWLPSVVVPLVFFSHFVCIRQLLNTSSPNSDI